MIGFHENGLKSVNQSNKSLEGSRLHHQEQTNHHPADAADASNLVISVMISSLLASPIFGVDF